MCVSVLVATFLCNGK